MEHQDAFSYITAESNNWRTARIPITNSKDWNMYEYIQRCKNVSNAWYHQGKNDGVRPYNDIVTPIINVAFRSEGFDVKDIVPFVNDAQNYYKSFLVKKYHPQWARKHELDTFIDEVVETSIIYDLVLVKNINNVRPEVVDLTTLAFCDQSDVLAAPICLKHPYTTAELNAFRGKWDDEAIDMAITQATAEKKIAIAEDQVVKTHAKYIEVFELRGDLPEVWINKEAKEYSYTPQIHIVCYYTDSSGAKTGITLFEGKDKPLKDNFKALKIDQVRSKGRACGRSIVETLFEPQVWNNYAGIKIKDLLDSALTVFQSSSDQFGNQKLSDLKTNTVLKHEPDRPITKLDGTLQNLPAFSNYQAEMGSNARVLGSASEGALGVNPTSGTPFALQNLIVQEGQGIHEYRQGKIATFFADVLYRDWILGYIVKDMNGGKKFSEDLTLDELQEIADTMSMRFGEEQKLKLVLAEEEVTQEIIDELVKLKKGEIMKRGTRGFFETIKGELDDLPLDVFVNIKGKQRKMAENADKITNVLREIIANPQAFQQIPGVGKAFNELLEESGMSPINFAQFTELPEQQITA